MAQAAVELFHDFVKVLGLDGQDYNVTLLGCFRVAGGDGDPIALLQHMAALLQWLSHCYVILLDDSPGEDASYNRLRHCAATDKSYLHGLLNIMGYSIK